MKIENNSIVIGRFAPTPSGRLHAGNILCAMLSYLSAVSKGGKYIVRIEDTDLIRCPRSVALGMLDTLDNFGLGSQEPVIWQSERSSVYAQKESELAQKAKIYPCFCSRAELHAEVAPRLSDGGVVYAGICRNLSQDDIRKIAAKRKPCYRVAVPDKVIKFTDGVAGNYSQNLRSECGDFIIRRSDGVYAYQFAVSVDDGESGVTEVVRGNDLISSTPRQIWLMQLMGYRPPTYYHIPLVCDCNGRKLSKSEGDDITGKLQTRSPQQILGALGYAARIIGEERPVTLAELVPLFDWNKIPRDKILLPPSLQ